MYATLRENIPITDLIARASSLGGDEAAVKKLMNLIMQFRKVSYPNCALLVHISVLTMAGSRFAITRSSLSEPTSSHPCHSRPTTGPST